MLPTQEKYGAAGPIGYTPTQKEIAMQKDTKIIFEALKNFANHGVMDADGNEYNLCFYYDGKFRPYLPIVKKAFMKGDIEALRDIDIDTLIQMYMYQADILRKDIGSRDLFLLEVLFYMANGLL